MAQHFLMSAKARTISPRTALAMSDDEARTKFAEMRWGNATVQVCPHCGVIASHRFVKLQDRWRCRKCYKAFSVTSGTVFSNHKLPLQVILAGIVNYANAVKGISALQMARDLDVQYKTAFVLLHKLRETIWKNKETDKLEGEVEIDGGYVHTYVRPKNQKEDRVDRTLAENQNPSKRVVLVMRERHQLGVKVGAAGAKRTRIFILKSENQNDIMKLAREHIARSATIFTDEATGYALLSAGWNHRVVNHSANYRAKCGANQNQAESYIARFRRLMRGQIHKLHPKYLDVYASEIAYREDNRREANGTFVNNLLRMCGNTGPSRDWSKYWQGNKRETDSLISC